VVGWPRGSGCGEQGRNLQRVQQGPLLSLPRHLGPSHGRRGVGRDDSVDDGVLVERGDGAEPAGHGSRGVSATFEVAHVHLELAAGDPQHLPVVGLAPTEVRLEVLGVGSQGRFPVAGQERGHRQPRHVQIPRHQLVDVVVVVITTPSGTAGSRSPGTAQIINPESLIGTPELALLDIFDVELAVGSVAR